MLHEQGSTDGIWQGAVYPHQYLHNPPELVLRITVIFALCKRLAAWVTAENEDLRSLPQPAQDRVVFPHDCVPARSYRM